MAEGIRWSVGHNREGGRAGEAGVSVSDLSPDGQQAVWDCIAAGAVFRGDQEAGWRAAAAVPRCESAVPAVSNAVAGTDYGGHGKALHEDGFESWRGEAG